MKKVPMNRIITLIQKSGRHPAIPGGIAVWAARFRISLPRPPRRGLPLWIYNTKKEKQHCFSYMDSGNVLLSRAVSSQVPSALKGLTSVFGMGTGGTPSPSSPEIVNFFFPRTLTTAQLFDLNFLAFSPISLPDFACNQALDRLVSSSYIRYRTSTDDLSTW